MEPIFEGSAVALVLPMLDDGSIDYDGFKRQVQRMIDGGVQAILVNGTTGETPTIHIDEEFELTKIVMEMTKGTGIKVIAGAGSNDTETALKKATDDNSSLRHNNTQRLTAIHGLLRPH